MMRTALALSLALGLALGVAFTAPDAAAAPPTPDTPDTPDAPTIIAPTLPARAPTPEAAARAQSAYELASRHFRAGRVDQALPHALAAWHDVPNTSSALIVATILAELRRPCDALPYLVLAADLDPVGDEPALIAALFSDQGPRCPPGYGWLAITATPPDATLELGSTRFAAPRTLAVRQGRHTLTASAPGHAPQHIDLTIDLSTDLTLAPNASPRTLAIALTRVAAIATVHPEPIAPLLPDSAPLVPPPAVATPNTALEWSLVGGGIAALAAGAICYGLAIDEAHEGNNIARATTPTDADRRALAASHSRTRDLETAAWVTGTVGALSLATGIALLAIAPSHNRADVVASPLTVHVGPDGVSATLRHAF